MKNVLIVDDEKSLILTLKTGFEAYKDQFNVLTAENGREAMKIMDSTNLDLVVTDLKMPVMDGLELLAYMSINLPSVPFIVMTAFGTPAIEKKLKKMNMLQMIEKPLDFEELVQSISEHLEGDGKEGVGTLSGISLSNFLQLIEMEQKTCLLEVRSEGKKQGMFYCKDGELYDAVCGDITGEEAVYKLLALAKVQLSFRSLPKKMIKRRIKTKLMSLLLGGLSQKDEHEAEKIDPSELDPVLDIIEGDLLQKEDADPQGSAEISVTKNHKTDKGVNEMAEIKEVLGKFKDVDGFQAVGAFSPNGEMVAEVNPAGIKIGELGALANDVLLKAQKATEIMGVGRGQLVHIEAPKAHIVARCLNEATDFAATSAGRAHVHMVVVLNKECNLAMAKMKVDGVIQEIAGFFR